MEIIGIAILGTIGVWLLWSFITFWKAAIEGNRAITKGSFGMPESQQRKNYARAIGSMGFVVVPFIWMNWQVPEGVDMAVLFLGCLFSLFIHSRPHKIIALIKGGGD